MARESDQDRIRHKAHELWEAEGRPHGRDQDHWDQAREIIAIQDSQADTLLPRDTGAEEPIESAEESLRNLADFPNLTDQGENLLTSTDREPTFESATANGSMPSVEVPTSDQPGIPEQPAKSKASPADKAAGQQSSSAPAQPVSAPATGQQSSSAPAQPVSAPAAVASQPKTASVPKKAAPETVKSSPAAKPPEAANPASAAAKPTPAPAKPAPAAAKPAPAPAKPAAPGKSGGPKRK